MATVGENIRKGVREPGRAYSYVVSRLHGAMLRFRHSGPGKRFVCGANFRVRGRLIVHGPGKVVIGDDVLFEGGPFNINTLYTYDENALITIGSHSFLNGLRIGCHANVAIGKWCIIADARITDSDDHPVGPNRWDPSSVAECKSVNIEDNVWIGLSAIVLKGVRIGRNSVVAAGSVVAKDVPPNTVVAGNPARPVREFTEEEIRSADEFFKGRDRYGA